jgi:pimeloyl-ACP methyl ester carboxylesterase
MQGVRAQRVPAAAAAGAIDVVLVAGLWLPVAEWDPVIAELAALGHRGLPVVLPGQDDGNADASLDDQLTAVLAAVDGADGNPLVVGHSAACSLAWLAADARPDKIARVALIGGFPMPDGATYADLFPVANGVMAFPGWGPFDEEGSTVDFDQATRDRLGALMAPVPEGVSRGVVHLVDDRRYEVPVTLVCPEFAVAQAEEWIASGEVPELPRVKALDFVDIDSGHWPMVTQPAQLARLLVAG